MAALAVLAAAAFAGYQLTREDPVDDPTGTTQPRSTGGGERLVPAATASCTASKSRDSTGNVTTYEPELVNDGDGATVWRCDSDGLGERLVLQFPEAVRLTSVGLIPGIVKVDAGDGTDRFVQNNKIARVRWTFDGGGDGDQVEQAFEATPALQRTLGGRHHPHGHDRDTPRRARHGGRERRRRGAAGDREVPDRRGRAARRSGPLTPRAGSFRR